MRAKFRGLIPESITAEECVDLMLSFAAFECMYIQNLLDLLDTMPARYVIPAKEVPQ